MSGETTKQWLRREETASKPLLNVIAAQRLWVQAISLLWSLTDGSRFYVTKRFVEWFYAFLRLSPLPLAGEG